jgi:hypothetical protein
MESSFYQNLEATASLNSCFSASKVSFTEIIFDVLQAFEPAKAYPLKKLPFIALISAAKMQ